MSSITNSALGGTRADRRGVLIAGGLGAAALALGARPAAGAARGSGVRTPRAFRVVHLTDSHVMADRRGFEGMSACLKHTMALDPKPDLVLTGGDLIMDSFAEPREGTQEQWDLFQRAFKEHCDVPVRHCLGNHDIWGWDKEKSKTSGDEPGWGKRWAVDLLGLPGAYYSFEVGGWVFVVLDSVRETEPAGGYYGGIDDAQLGWLRSTLEKAGKERPVLVVSHIPILTGATLMSDGRFTADGVLMQRGNMIHNGDALVRLFEEFPNMRLCLSGHIHVVERLDYQGVTYLCSGAVSGAWWEGREVNQQKRTARAKPGDPLRPMRCQEGYAVLDLFPDGTFIHQYVTFGWTA